MATPKKLYPVEGGIDLSSCRICGSIGDSRCCKNLFSEANRDILDFVQQVYLSCERKVRNAATVMKTIAETQRLLAEKKKPSEEKNRPKVSARTSLSFEACAACSSLSEVSVSWLFYFI